MCEQARFVCAIGTGCTESPLFLGIFQGFCSCVHKNEVSLHEHLNICVWESVWSCFSDLRFINTLLNDAKLCKSLFNLFKANLGETIIKKAYVF